MDTQTGKIYSSQEIETLPKGISKRLISISPEQAEYLSQFDEGLRVGVLRGRISPQEAHALKGVPEGQRRLILKELRKGRRDARREAGAPPAGARSMTKEEHEARYGKPRKAREQ